MRQLIKRFLWIGCLAWGLQAACAFSLLGPVGNGDDSFQQPAIGYSPLGNGGAPPFILDPLNAGPKNINDGYRPNTPVVYYTFDPSFSDWFGTGGEAAVEQAFGILNGLTNMDSYSANLSEFPLKTESVNYQAQALQLNDLKSVTLAMLLQQLGLADSVRYTWALLDRDTSEAGSSCTPPLGSGIGTVQGYLYAVIQRNYDVNSNPNNQIFSAYVNGELYSYYIYENCGAPSPFSPPDADALEIPVNSSINNPPVSSGVGEDGLLYTTTTFGCFFTGLTRDDAAGLRFLLSTNNIFAPSLSYREAAAAGSLLYSTNVNAPQLLYTSNFNALAAASLTNSPAALQALFPGLVVGVNPVTYFSNVVSMNVIFVTNTPIGGVAGQQYNGLQTNYVTNIVQFYLNTFGNVVTNPANTNQSGYPTTTYQVQTITVGPPIGSTVGSPFATNVSLSSPFQSNVVSGDYFIITNGTCGPNFVQTLQTNVNIVTNNIIAETNANGEVFVQNLISYFTNHVFVVQPCTLVPNAIGDYQGVGRIQFVYVDERNYDYQSGLFSQPITNQYTMVINTNRQLVTQAFRRVVTAPDIVFTGQNWDQGGNGASLKNPAIQPSTPNFNTSLVSAGHSGPGTISYGSGSNVVISFNEVGPVYRNTAPFVLIGPNPSIRDYFAWASFDGTTNAPVIYPTTASLASLAVSAFVQVFPPPPTLPAGTNGIAYNVALTATGGQTNYTWSLTFDSAGLPPGLTLTSANSVGSISGTPTQSGTFDNIIIQMTDSSTPPLSIVMDYSITIH